MDRILDDRQCHLFCSSVASGVMKTLDELEDCEAIAFLLIETIVARTSSRARDAKRLYTHLKHAIPGDSFTLSADDQESSSSNAYSVLTLDLIAKAAFAVL